MTDRKTPGQAAYAKCLESFYRGGNPTNLVEHWEAIAQAAIDASQCNGCDCPLERCGPKLWVQQKKCCPDCSHVAGTSIYWEAIRELTAERDQLKRENESWRLTAPYRDTAEMLNEMSLMAVAERDAAVQERDALRAHVRTINAIDEARVNALHRATSERDALRKRLDAVEALCAGPDGWADLVPVSSLRKALEP